MSAHTFVRGKILGKGFRVPVKGKFLKKRSVLLRGSLFKISQGDLKRLARQGGIKRISPSSLVEAREALYSFLKRTIKDAFFYCQHARRVTVSTNDIMYSLKKQGITMYR